MTAQQAPTATRGLLVIGHGSRRAEANATLHEVARLIAAQTPFSAVSAAFLELSEPDIATGYAELVARGCTEIVVHPFFLFPGMHTIHDIPAQLAVAADRYPGTQWRVTEPLGLHPGVISAATDRIATVLAGAEHPDHSVT
jgi:sirohydrochlorin ferrochelatase